MNEKWEIVAPRQSPNVSRCLTRLADSCLLCFRGYCTVSLEHPVNLRSSFLGGDSIANGFFLSTQPHLLHKQSCILYYVTYREYPRYTDTFTTKPNNPAGHSYYMPMTINAIHSLFAWSSLGFHYGFCRSQIFLRYVQQLRTVPGLKLK